MRFGRRTRFTGPQLMEILEVCTTRPLPNYYFGNPARLAAGSAILRQQRDDAVHSGRRVLNSYGRPIKRRQSGTA